MEKIRITNFLLIKELDIELKRINVFIGPQAQGKSIVAKLIKFFKEIPLSLSNSIAHGKESMEFRSHQLSKFNKMFPEQYWIHTVFNIEYSNKYFSINLIKDDIDSTLQINFSNSLLSAENSARTFNTMLLEEEERRISEEETASEPVPKRIMLEEIRRIFVEKLFNECENPSVDRVFYVPAGRSFFANLQKNIFSFINSDIKIDYFLTEFGSIYENVKDLRRHSFIKESTPKLVNDYFESLIKGSFVVEDGEDWIVGDNGKINVINSSSGQQEALPMALVMSIWPYIELRLVSKSFIIEEPEAHLFPSAQGEMTSLIANAYNYNSNTSIIITTHSPYILSALNVCIQAKNTLIDNPDKSELVHRIVPQSELIDHKDVSAFLINDGAAKNIFDEELNLIDASEIDNISNIFANRYDDLLDIQFGED
ncbi:AAA family ATPase [Providencia sp.]|uniref:AAA family ATPase n=1 Tax=Providencia sp. TaxID=589 RepID=UPI0035B2E254